MVHSSLKTERPGSLMKPLPELPGPLPLVQLLLKMLWLVHLGTPLEGNHLHTHLRGQSQTQDDYSKTCMPRSCEVVGVP